MKKRVVNLPTVQMTEQIAGRLTECLVAPLVLTLSGEIGAGKTTFMRAVLRHLGVASRVKSPTFSLIESYQTPHFQVHHFDLYRIQDESELEYIGFRDYFSETSVCCIEWPEKASSSLALVDVELSFKVMGKGRQMHALAHSEIGIKVLSYLTGML
jgi:tRNA threonylcarbamoyladenosine biosynthesis protein TsaE